jgi:peptidoglycan/LPS O-acetylase OafA/YrhL
MSARLIYLDTGRGFAAIVVLWHHVMVLYGPQIEVRLGKEGLLVRLLEAVSNLNFHAVMLFFFISGWSIFLSLRGIDDLEGQPRWRVYFWHRARRILPLFWFSLLWSWTFAVLGSRHDIDQSISTLVGNLVFLQTAATAKGTLFVPFAGNGPLWSLSYEVWYYLALPVLHWVIASNVSKPFRKVEVGVFVSIGLGVLMIGLQQVLPNPFILFATLWPVWLAGYLFGSCASKGRLEIRAAFSVVLAALALLGLTLILRSDTLGALRDGYLAAACVVGVIQVYKLPLLAQSLGWWPMQCVVRGFAYIGIGSYTIYILHYPLLSFLKGAVVGGGLRMVFYSLLGLVLLAPLFEMWLQVKMKRLEWFRYPIHVVG